MYILIIENKRPVTKEFQDLVALEAYASNNRYKQGRAVLSKDGLEIVKGHMHDVDSYATAEYLKMRLK